MSIVNIQNVEIVNNPAKFTDPYVFRIQFECIAPLKEDLEWKLVYVGSAESDDQELDSCMVGPIPVGLNSFEFSAAAPALSSLPTDSPSGIPTPAELVGVTVIILSALYNDTEFVRVGYYVATNWDSEEYATSVEEGKVGDGEMDRLVRSVTADTPRVTRFSNKWDEADEPEQTTTSTPSALEPTAGPDSPTRPHSLTDSVLPAPITAVSQPTPAPPPSTSTTTATTTVDASAPQPASTETEAEDKEESLKEAETERPIAAGLEEADRMGMETAGDVGRGEEAGEGLAGFEGAALKEI